MERKVDQVNGLAWLPLSAESVPFSLLGDKVKISELCRDIFDQYGLSAEKIEDVYPCSQLQEGLFSLTEQRPGEYVKLATLDIAPQISTDAFRNAWEHIVKEYQILRTRIIQIPQLGGLFQVVLRDSIEWEQIDDIEEYVRIQANRTILFGQPLTQYGICTKNAEGNKATRRFVWACHHALYDGWFLNHISETLKTLLSGRVAKNQLQFKEFIRHLTHSNKREARDYWESYLTGFQASPFPARQRPQKGGPINRAEVWCPISQKKAIRLKMSTMIYGAWAMVVALNTGVTDVVFGTVLSGRQSLSHVGLQEVSGPVIVTVPVRVCVEFQESVKNFLEKVQLDGSARSAFEQMGLHNISRISDDTRRACEFQTLVTNQPVDGFLASDDELGNWAQLLKGEHMTYGLAIQCFLDKSRGGMTIRGRADDRFVTQKSTQKLLEQFSWAIQQLAGATPDQALSTVNFLPTKDREMIWDWNRKVPATVENCIHELIVARARCHPATLAICAWDGDFTYAELDAYSTQLAYHLIERGIQAETIVPLCFEKSRWTGIAMLAVLKAGGAFVLLEPSQPTSRLQLMLRQIQPTLMLTSTTNYSLGCRLMSSSEQVLAVGPESPELAARAESCCSMALPTVTPGSLMYVVFTSGSTGTPKGVMIPHQAFASAAHHQSQHLGISPSSRVLDFSAYSFDIALRNFFTTLASGGCLVVPSEQARQDDITGFIVANKVNTAHFTPSVARTLHPHELNILDKVLLGGEEVLLSDVTRWPAHVKVIIGYGPSECTPTTTLNSNIVTAVTTTTTSSAPSLGRGVGAVTWIVDPNDHNVLQAVGLTGELLVEGPLVGRGYLGEPDKTAAAFIEDPRWLVEGVVGHCRGRRGRLYKTGDLVRYSSEDGKLSFVGRKDAQVKIRGQRVELGEVEHHVHACLPQAGELAAEVITPSGSSSAPMLVVFATGIDDLAQSEALYARDSTDAGAAVVLLSTEIEDQLEERLPQYMVPTLFCAVKQLPMTPTGKTDRLRLRAMGASFSTQQLVDLRSTVREKRQPSTEVERMIQSICAQVLNIAPETIGLDDSFIRLGGDSITAMQMSSASRASGLLITTSDILRQKSISQIVAAVSFKTKLSAAIRQNLDVVNELFDLSPIQKLYFSCQHHSDAHFDQSFLLELTSPCCPSSLPAHLETLVKVHSVLHSRFVQDTHGRWKQFQSEDIAGSYQFYHSPEEDGDEMLRSMTRCRESLNLEHGPLVVAALFTQGKRQRLFISIHHLVVDYMSWRILLDDLETLINGNNLQLSPSISFQTWCRIQAEHASKSLVSARNLSFKIQPRNLSYWHDNLDSILLAERVVKEFTIPRRQTQALLAQCNEPFQTRPVELMLAGLVHSFNLAFVDRASPVVFCEAHGREPWDNSIDVSRTVGWFTTMFPVQIMAQRSKLLSIVAQVKDCVRGIADNGWPFFTWNLLNEDQCSTSLLNRFPVEILFNYSGQYQQLERPNARFRRMRLNGFDVQPSLRERSIAVLDVGIQVEQGSLVISIKYPPSIKHHQEILLWAKLYEASLVEVADVLLRAPRRWTLCDFPLAFDTYDNLDQFIKKTLPNLGITDPNSVEDVFPCSPMQEAILISQARTPDNYRSCLVARVATAVGEKRVDPTRIENSWTSIVARHPILRAILVPDVPGMPGTAHVVLKHPDPSISHFRINEGRADHQIFRAHYDPVTQIPNKNLQHHLSICVCNNDDVYVCLEINHAISDGHSVDILLQELQAAYAGVLPHSPAVSYREFSSYVKNNAADVTASEFWAYTLVDAEPCLLPVLPGQDKRPQGTIPLAKSTLDYDQIMECCERWEVTPATVIQTAWGIVLRQYTGMHTTWFGSLTSGRDLPIDHLNEMIGPLIALLPCRVIAESSKTVLEVMKDVQSMYLESIPYQTSSLGAIHSFQNRCSSPLFNTLLSFQKAVDEAEDLDTIRFLDKQWVDPTDYIINLSVTHRPKSIDVGLRFKESDVSMSTALGLQGALVSVVARLAESPHRTINKIDILGLRELNLIWQWNSTVPSTIERCVHEMIERQIWKQPKALAVCAWDGDLTYSELGDLSTRLAYHLIDLGVRSEVLVPLCFEKSRWTSVAMLAVLKAGGAFVLLEPSLPTSRFHSIIQHIQPIVILASNTASRLETLSENAHVLVVGPDSPDLATSPSRVLPTVCPSSLLYVVFTSGSTGTPKGVMIPHNAFASATYYQSPYLGLSSTSRVLDFSAYSFDVSISNHLMTYINGGCLCVPFNEDRKDNISKFISSAKVNVAHFTPSLARTIQPSDCLGLKTLLIGGEAVHISDVRDWLDVVDQMVNAYGPAECTPFSTLNLQSKDAPLVPQLGKGAGAVTWVVDPANNSLLPIGVVGELLLEGPILGRGYLSDPEKTATAFIEDPYWLTEGVSDCYPGRRGRLYKTGDLVRYTEDGTLIYVGRKDTQVKIRGQRVELGEVEYHIQICLPQATGIAAEMISPRNLGGRSILAVFIAGMDVIEDARCFDEDASDTVCVIILSGDIENQIAQRLPSYMMPTVFFGINQIPITPTGKTDRKRLREVGLTFSTERLAEIHQPLAKKRRPTSQIEFVLQRLWASVLDLDLAYIGLDDSLFHLGGNSLTVIRLVSEARREGLTFSAADVFQHPRLVDLSRVVIATSLTETVDDIPPFCLLGNMAEVASCLDTISSTYRIDPKTIQDIYPCTPLQEGLIALTSKVSGSYTLQYILDLSAEVDIDKFRKAWDIVIKTTPILRTRIVQDKNGKLLQLVVDNEFQWTQAHDVKEYLGQDSSIPMEMGQPLARYCIVSNNSGSISQKEPRSFIWTLHHALYDGASLPLIMDLVRRVYDDTSVVASTPFNQFIRALQNNDQLATTAYWQSELNGFQSTPFPSLPIGYNPKPDTRLTCHSRKLPKIASDTTLTTLVRAAWSIVSSLHSGQNDVVFGATVSGRYASVTGIERIIGPTIATVPVRIQIPSAGTAASFLQYVQNIATNMIPHEQASLQGIAQMSAATRQACGFQALIIVQPPEDASTKTRFGKWQVNADIGAFNTFALSLNCFISGDKIDIVATFDSKVLDPWLMEHILDQFSWAICQLAHAKDQALWDINFLPPSDRETVWRWNSILPSTMNSCVHELVQAQARSQPQAPAIHAWDGHLSYTELDRLSDTLAHSLVYHGVQPEFVVPLLFEKSKWTSVAILATLKAGGAFVLLEPSLPVARLRSIIECLQQPVLMLASSANYSLGTLLAPDNTRVIKVEPDSPEFTLRQGSLSLSAASSQNGDKILPSVSSSSLMYVVFTSGSTGTPKGVMIPHNAFASATHHQSFNLGLSFSKPRVLDFSAYSFDVAISNHLMTLVNGGCLCVPSEEVRKDSQKITDFMTSARVDVAHFTPSLARTLQPRNFPNLKTLLIGGEAVQVSDVREWLDVTTMVNAYGPAECTPFSTINQSDDATLVPRLGKGVGAVTWVVDPANHDILLPVGVTGELVLEGPIVGRGYLGEPGKTALVFIDNPKWLVDGASGYPGRQGRLYKTGDLVHYNNDGTLSFVGRKDSQVKIRGQRVELGEVEYNVQSCIPQASDVTAEVITATNQEPMLAIFMAGINNLAGPLMGSFSKDSIKSDSPVLIRIPTEIEDKLSSRLPSYMVPTLFFTMNQLPLTATGKTDRNRLRQMVSSFSMNQLAELRSSAQTTPQRQPTTEIECLIQRLWAHVLHIDTDHISIDDNFFRLGGNSIAVMRLVSRARIEGLVLSAIDVFRHPRLGDLAEVVVMIPTIENNDVPAFSLLGGAALATSYREHISSTYALDFEMIQDIYPCTPLQEGLLVSTIKTAGRYMLQNILDITELDEKRFRDAWNFVAEKTPILRTRFVQLSNGRLMQVVIKEGFKCAAGSDLQKYLARDNALPLEMGRPLSRYGLVSSTASRQKWFIWSIHHSLYDGTSLPIVIDLVRQAYHGLPVTEYLPFNQFGSYLQDMDRQDVRAYWKSTLEGYHSAAFPPLPPTAYDIKPDTKLTSQCAKLSSKMISDTTLATLVRASWAMVSSIHSGSNDIVFGATLSGRQANVVGIERIVGPVIATVPIRIQVPTTNEVTVATFLSQIQRMATEMIPYEQAGLQDIGKISEHTRQACTFQTLLVVQPPEDLGRKNQLGQWKVNAKAETFNMYALTINCFLSNHGGVDVIATFDSHVVEPWLVERLLDQFTFTIQELASARPDQAISSISLIPPREQETLWGWNKSVPSTITECVHDMIEKIALSQPTALAICAWDGEFTYGDLSTLSTRLAYDLVQNFGLQPNIVVPICFEKSCWTSVAILAVLKAGCAFVLLEPTQPESRLKSIIQRIQTPVILTSAASYVLGTRLVSIAGQQVVAVTTDSPQFVEDLSTNDISRTLPSLDSSSLMYVVFTSGSTGTPKGVMISHTAFASATRHQSPSLELSQSSRVSDFCAYSFDVAISNHLMTLINGACLCVPSEEMRQGAITEFLSSMKVTIAHFTPSLARTLQPYEFPYLRTLHLGGEATQISDVREWPEVAHVINAYGPAECTPISTINTNSATPALIPRIGKGAGAVTWIVDPTDHERLLPLGATGELLIEGPVVGLGYLDDPNKTAAAFIDSPRWLLDGVEGVCSGRNTRLYKTGDLVRYHDDGSLTFVGRKDIQVKIRGQRVELGEVEHQVHQYIPQASNIVAEIIVPSGQGSGPLLVVFMSGVENWAEKIGKRMTTASEKVFVIPISMEVEDQLAQQLPNYMVPSLFFAITPLPMTTSGKTDRKRLRELASKFSMQELAELPLQDKQQPTTDTEVTLQRLWAQVLETDVVQIGINDSFFRLGGNSISVIRLVSMARAEGYLLSAIDVFRRPRLVDQSQALVSTSATVVDIAPFSLVNDSINISAFCDMLSSVYGLATEKVQDIYPCTPLQEGLIALTSKSPGSYTLQNVLTLSPDLDLPRFRAAWELVVQSTPILRTRIVQEGGRLLQVVVDEEMQCIDSDDLQDYLTRDKSLPMAFGQPLSRYGLVTGQEQPCWFVWSIHHSLYDRTSLQFMIDLVSRAYDQVSFEFQTPYNSFIKYLNDIDHRATQEFWRTTLSGHNCIKFPSASSMEYHPKPDTKISSHCTRLSVLDSDATLATLVRAAWAMVTSQYTGSKDVVFGATISGRHAGVVGIERLVGPTIATVPVRIEVPTTGTVTAYLSSIQTKATEMIPYEQAGLHEIAKISEDARRACNFQTLLVVQPPDDQQGTKYHLGQWQANTELGTFNTYALTLNCFLSDTGGMETVATFDSQIVDQWLMEQILTNFTWTMQQLAAAGGNQPISELHVLPTEHYNKIYEWNDLVPTQIDDKCVHELIESRALSQPNAPAVCAWDGNLTYMDLQNKSTQLAYHLIDLGVQAEVIVPLCFEKSLWTSVAMLAVLKVGAAFILLDPSQPASRLRAIVDHVQPTVILSSMDSYDLTCDIVSEAVIVCVGDDEFDSSPSILQLPQPMPTSLLYVVFTSGSTGKPKGVMIPHCAFATAAHYQLSQASLNLTSSSRVLDFSSYSFDVAIWNHLMTFIAGGCLCVPSENMRKDDITGFIRSTNVNFAQFTPSLARTLRPKGFPKLETLLVAGEAVQTSDVKEWLDIAQVIVNAYGPAECTPFSTINSQSITPSLVSRIGHGFGAVTWVVDPTNHDILLPLGTTGELIIEGPIVGRGYLNEPEKNTSAFIENPRWLRDGLAGSLFKMRQGRLYKTGDLVRYNEDGSLTFMGRKDTQVKIRGQRVELAEVEHHLRKTLPQDFHDLAVELITPTGPRASPMLAVFVTKMTHLVAEKAREQAQRDDSYGEVAVIMLPDVEDKLSECLPAYMVPTLFFAVTQLPLTSTGKTDRRRLREIGSTFSTQQLAALRSSLPLQKRQPTTEVEHSIQSLWAHVLDLEPASIGLDDGFFRLGGNSITAMRLVGEARSRGFLFSVADVFRQPRLEHFAATVCTKLLDAM